MQSASEQQQSNQIRYSIYREKLTPSQRRAADIAAQVSAYAQKLDLNVLQRSAAIKLAVAKLADNCTDDQAAKIGTRAARSIALASANVKYRRHTNLAR